MTVVARQALLCWIAALALSVVALFALLGPPATAGGAGEAVGRLVAHTGIAALIGWYVARRATPPWSWARFVLVYLALFVVLAVVAAAGHAR